MKTQHSGIVETSLAILSLIALAPALELEGQDLIGQVVRIHDAPQLLSSDGKVFGTEPGVGALLGTRGDTLIIENGDSNQVERWLLGGSSRVELRRRTSAERRGAIIGVLVGGLAGLFVAHSTSNPTSETRCADGGITVASTAWLPIPFCNRWEEVEPNGIPRALLGVSLGGLTGIMLGRAIGKQFEVDSWIPVGVRGQVSLGIGVAQVGTGWGPEVQVTF